MDPILLPWLKAESEAQADAELARILLDHAAPVAHRTVRSRLPEADWSDLESDVRLELVQRLHSLRRGHSEPIHDFAAYVAVSSYRVCYSWLRERRPNHTRLRNQIRYIVESDPASAARIQPQPGPVPALPSDAAFSHLAHLPLRDLVARVLRSLPAAARTTLHDLTALIARLTNVRDDPPPPPTEHATPNPEDHILAGLDRRHALREIWTEIQTLPLPQRHAVLLSLRMIEALPVCGIATLRQIAAVLEMPPTELADLWNHLPLEDNQIAQRLGLARQQIINLRKSARERLLRHTHAKWGALVISATFALLHLQQRIAQ